LTTKHVGGTVVVVVVVVVVVGRAIAWNATDASLDDMVNGIFGGMGDVLDGLVGRRRHCFQRRHCLRRRQWLGSRLTTKHGGGTVVVVVGRAIALKATDASLDDTVDGIFDVVLAVLVLVVLVVEERPHQGLDSRLTAKHVGGTVVAVVVVLVNLLMGKRVARVIVFGILVLVPVIFLEEWLRLEGR